MFKLQTIMVLICATTVLTLSVTKSGTDGSSKESHVDSVEHLHDSGAIHTDLKPITKTEKNLLNDNSHAAATVGAAGAPHQTETPKASSIAPKTASKATVVAEGIKLTSEDLVPLEPKSKLPKTRNASVVPRKGAVPTSKISPRKGVSLESSVPTESSMEGMDEAVHPALSSVVKSSRKNLEQVAPKIDQKNATKKDATEEKSAPEHISIPIIANNDNSTIKINSPTPETSNNVSSTVKTIISEATSSTQSPKPFKPKPTVTVGEMDIDKPIPASPTKTPPLGMPRKIDYIVPVIITIMALPLLAGTAFFLYRRGRDCWDKRHYRRMDFLIDGMYNDYSWK